VDEKIQNARRNLKKEVSILEQDYLFSVLNCI
jgi:hypothetical protein